MAKWILILGGGFLLLYFGPILKELYDVTIYAGVIEPLLTDDFSKAFFSSFPYILLASFIGVCAWLLLHKDKTGEGE